jgi:hypothetical protein
MVHKNEIFTLQDTTITLSGNADEIQVHFDMIPIHTTDDDSKKKTVVIGYKHQAKKIYK